MRVPTPCTPALIEAIAVVTALDKKAQAALDAVEPHADAYFVSRRALLEQVAKLGREGDTTPTREQIIELAAGDPGVAQPALAALETFNKANRTYDRAQAVFDRAVDQQATAAAKILKVAVPPAEVPAKVIAFLKGEDIGAKISRSGKITVGIGDHTNSLLRALEAVLGSLTTPPPPPPVGLSPELADLLMHLAGANDALTRTAAESDEARAPIFDAMHSIERQIFNFPARSAADCAAKLDLAARTIEEGGYADNSVPTDVELDVMREVVAFLRGGPQVPDPIADSLTRADLARGLDPGEDLNDAYWRELDGPVAGDPCTPRGMAWQLARIYAQVERIGGNAEPLNEYMEEAWAKANEEIERLGRAIFRMGVEPTLALTTALPISAYEVNGHHLPVGTVDGERYAAARTAFHAALEFAAADGSDEAYDAAADAEMEWARTPAPNLAAVIEKMEVNEGDLDAEGSGDRPRGFRCARWIERVETLGDSCERYRLRVFRDLLRLAGIDDHPAAVVVARAHSRPDTPDISRLSDVAPFIAPAPAFALELVH